MYNKYTYITKKCKNCTNKSRGVATNISSFFKRKEWLADGQGRVNHGRGENFLVDK